MRSLASPLTQVFRFEWTDLLLGENVHQNNADYRRLLNRHDKPNHDIG